MEGVTKQASVNLPCQSTHPKVYAEVYTVNIILWGSFFCTKSNTYSGKAVGEAAERLLPSLSTPSQTGP